MHVCIWHYLLPLSMALGDDHLQVTGVRNSKKVMCDSKIIAEMSWEQMFLAEGNLGLMQLNRWRKKKKSTKYTKPST